MGTLKYTARITVIRNCPPQTCREVLRNAYRFVFEAANSEINFKPIALQQPEKYVNFNEIAKCMSLGLSFFDSAENAETKFRSLRKKIPQIHRKLGTSLAQVELTPNHGLATNPDKISGHFTLHEYSGTVWKWNIIKPLV